MVQIDYSFKVDPYDPDVWGPEKKGENPVELIDLRRAFDLVSKNTKTLEKYLTERK